MVYWLNDDISQPRRGPVGLVPGMVRRRKVEFTFDERSLMPIEKAYPPGTRFEDVIVRNPKTGEERRLRIPKPVSR